MSASFVTVTKTLVNSGEFPGGAAVAGDKEASGDANVVPAGKPGADAMETLTVAGPAVPGEAEPAVPPPPPQAARAKAIAPTISMETSVRDIPFGVLIFPSSFVVLLDMVSASTAEK
jgi:hypothetical protein